MSNASTFYGGFVKTGDGATPTENFTAISEVLSVDLGGSKVDQDDVTHAQSPNRFKEFIFTLIDGGDISFTFNHLPTDATQVNLTAVKNATKIINWKIVLPNNLGTYSFAGGITSIDYKMPIAKKMEGTCKVKISGPVVLA